LHGGSELSEEENNDEDEESDAAENVGDDFVVAGEEEFALGLDAALAWRGVILPAKRKLCAIIGYAVVWRRAEFELREVIHLLA